MEESTLDSIHRVMQEISEVRAKLKTVKDHAADTLEQNDDYRRLQDELKELTAKRAELKKVMTEDQDYQKLASELQELKFQLKDLQEILSHHLVAYYNETQSTQIRDPDGEVRSVILSAKVGKPEFTPQD